MALSLAQNAIALLIDLAERGEIDPWNVKVIDVIDRFLSQLNPLNSTATGRAAYEANLSESGQAFLYASVLVLLKADSLARSDVVEEDGEELDDDLMLLDGGTTPLPANLERRIRRRAVAQPPRNRRVTLQELITQLELMAAAVADHAPRIRARRPRPQSRSQAVRAIAELAHQENLSEVAAALDAFIAEHWETLGQGQEWLEFESLLELWIQSDNSTAVQQPNAHRTEQSDRVGVFWALLFLSAQSKVELAQEHFYQDLKVRKLGDETGDDAGVAAAIVLLD